MTNIIKSIDPDDYSVVEDADCASIATAHTPEIPPSNLPADKEQQVSDASDIIPLQYLRTLVKLRVATKSHHEECFLQAYSNIVCQEFAGLSLQNYDTSSIKDMEARVVRRNTLFTNVIQNVDLVCASFDSAIKAYIRALNHDTKLTAIREHETYFRGVLDSAATAFNSLEFVTSPDSYLDKFTPWLVSDEDFSLTNWRTYIAYHASPLVRYFLEKHIADTEDWGSAKAALVAAFALKALKEDSPAIRCAVAEMGSWSDISAHLKNAFYTQPRSTCMACLMGSRKNYHSCTSWGAIVAKYYNLSFICGITNNSQQELIVAALKENNVADIATFDFSTL